VQGTEVALHAMTRLISTITVENTHYIANYIAYFPFHLYCSIDPFSIKKYFF